MFRANGLTVEQFEAYLNRADQVMSEMKLAFGLSEHNSVSDWVGTENHLVRVTIYHDAPGPLVVSFGLGQYDSHFDLRTQSEAARLELARLLAE